MGREGEILRPQVLDGGKPGERGLEAKACYSAGRDDSGHVRIEHPSTRDKFLKGETQSKIRTPASEEIRLIPSWQLHCATERDRRHHCSFHQKLILTHQYRIPQPHRARTPAHDCLSVLSHIKYKVSVLKRIPRRIHTGGCPLDRSNGSVHKSLIPIEHRYFQPEFQFLSGTITEEETGSEGFEFYVYADLRCILVINTGGLGKLQPHVDRARLHDGRAVPRQAQHHLLKGLEVSDREWTEPL